METPQFLKGLNAAFNLLKSTLLLLKQTAITLFASSKKQNSYSLIPITIGANENRSSLSNRYSIAWNKNFSTALLLLTLLLSGITSWGQTLTTATGGSAISADTFGSGTYTTLTGPVYSEASNGNVGTGTIILNAPTGFVFDTGGTAPTVVVARIGGTGNSSRDINDGSGTYSITSRTTSQITFTVTAASASGVTCSLTWQNVRVKPTAGSPLASGNITKTGTSSMSGVTNSSTNLGTLTEVSGNATKLAFTTQPSGGTYGTSLNPVVILQDQYSNPTTKTSANLATLNVTMAIASGTGSVSGTTSLNIGTAGGNGTVTFSNLKTTTIGAKTITASATGLTSVTSSSFTVTAAPLTITGNNVNKTYGTAISSPGAGQTTFTLSGIQNSETVGSVTLSYGTGSAATVAVGSYATVTPSVATGGTFTASNYSITYTAGSIIIGAKALTIGTPTIASKAYDGTTTAGAVTVGALSGLIGSETVTATATAANYSSANVASYTGTVVTYTLANGANGGLASNYSLANGTAIGSITTRAITIDANDVNKTYGQTLTSGAGSSAYTVTSGALQNGETPTVTITYGTGAAATATVGTNTNTVVPSAAIGGGFTASNYAITYGNGNIVVGQAPLTITANAVNKTYGATLTGAAGSTAFTSSGLQNGQTIGTVTIAYGTGAAASAAVATYTGSVTPSAATGGTFTASNYSITYATGNIVVGQASLTITANAVNKTYGATLTGGAGSTAFTPSGLQNGQTIGTVTIAYGTGAAANAAVGTYNTVTPSAATGGTFTASNYSITYATGNIVVGKANLTITANDVNKTYGATLTGAAGSTAFTPSGLQNAETIGSVTIAYGTGSAATAAVGTNANTVTPSAAIGGTFAATNYNITYATGDIIVGQASLTITANAVNKTYGATLSGGAGSTAFTSSGLQNGQTIGTVTIAYGTGAAATAAVATYTGAVTPSTATGGTFTASNYSITYATGNIVVGKANLTITANDVNKTYGATLSGAAGSTAFTSSGLQNSETIGSVTIAYGTGAAATAAVATNANTVTPSAATGGTFNANNYNITYAAGDIIVGKANLTITANDVNKTYGNTLTGAAGSTAFTSSGLQNGQTIGTVTIAYGTGSAATATVATYSNTVTPSAATGGTFAAANYNITYATGDIIVDQAALTITANDANKTYGTSLTGTSGSSAFTSSGLKNGQTIGTVTIAYGTGAAATAAFGTYNNTITPSAATGGTFTPSNYAITYSNGDIIVSKANLTITANDVTKTYGATLTGAAGSTAFTPSGLQNAETIGSVTIAYGTGAASNAAVATYNNTVTPSAATGGTFSASNYNISYANGDITVTPGAFAKLQILLPGETAAPGSGSGKTGTPTAQTTVGSFTVTVNAVDAFWNIVSSAPANTIAITSSDVAALVPANATLASGTRTFSITLRTPGSSTITASNVTNGAITANTSASVTVTAGTKTSTKDGSWTDSTVWSPAGEPYQYDLVSIGTNHDITVPTDAACASINFTGTNSTLSVSSGKTLDVSGALTLNSYNSGTYTDAEILGLGTLNVNSLNIGLASVLNNTSGSDNTLDITITTMNVAGDITMYNNDEGGGDANRPELYINSPCVLSASKVNLIQTGNGSGGSRIILFDVDNGATVNLSGGLDPITISSEVDLDFDHVDFDFGSSSTINYNGSVVQNIPASISNSKIGGSTNSSVPVNYGNLTITNSTGTTTSTSSGRTINVAGNWTNNGSFTATSSTVNFNGTGAQAITGGTVTTFNDVTIGKTAGTLSVSTNAIVGDDLTFTTSGSTLSVNNPNVLTVNDVITVNTSTGGISVANSISGTGTLNAGAVLVGTLPGDINSGNSAYTTTLTSTIAEFTITNNIDLKSYRGNGNRRSNAVFNHASGTINLNGEVVITNQHDNNETTFSMATAPQTGLLKLANATPFSLSVLGTNTINLNGTAAVVEYMGTVNQNALGTTYRTLKINNSNAGTGVTLSGNASATTLDLTDGLLTTGANTMTVVSGGSVVNATADSYVSGKLARVITSTATTTYPVGKGGVYSPVEFTYAAAPGTKTVTIEQFETGSPFTNSASLATFGGRYWNVTQSATGTAYRIGLNDGGNSSNVPSGAAVVILRKDNTTITPNATNYSAPNYTNATAFAASNASNDVSLGVNNIPLTITGITGITTKTYDGTTIATALGTPTLVGTVLPGDTVTLGGIPAYTFDTKHIGTGKPVTVTGFTLGGTNGGGYSLPTNQIAGLTGDITVRPITVTAVSSSKVYDGNTTSSVTPSYILQAGDTASSIPTQTFDTKDFGTTKTLTPTGLVINDGNGGNNYTISYSPANLGTITQKSLTASLTAAIVSKSYDGSTTATLTTANFSLTSIVGSEDVTITNTNGTYDNKNFGTGKTITVTGLVLGGSDAANYSLSNPTAINRNVGTITKTTLIASIIGTVSKEYDGNNSATLASGNYTLSGLVPLEDVTITNTSGTYDNKKAGINKTVTVTGLAMIGADSSNYNLFATATGTIGEITQKPITITGATSHDKIYDTTTEAAVTGGSIVGILGADDVLLIQEGTFPSINAGGPYVITATCRIAGDDALNYSLVQPTLANASINPKELTLKDLATTDKVYDATNSADLTGGELLGLYPVDGSNITFIPSGYYADTNVGNWTITSTTSLSGSASGNYYLTQPVFAVKKDITPKGLTITGFTANDKVYDGTTTASINSSIATLSGVLSGQTVDLNSASVTANFDTKDVGTNKTVTIGGFTISGPDASNYEIIQPTATAEITSRPLTITAADQSKCSGSPLTFVGDEFTKDFNVSGDITSVTLTIIGGDGSISGIYPIRPSAAIGTGVTNYGPITYVDGSLLVKSTPTATISGTASVCLNDIPAIITFTGSNGSGSEQYKFYYTINGGSELFVTSNPGVNTATVSVATAITRTDVYTLTRVEDLNNGCSHIESGSATLTIGACTQVRPSLCGQTLPALDTAFQVSPVSGATQYRFEVTRIDTDTETYITTPNYYFYPASQIPGGLVYGKSYAVKVQLFIGTWLAYGSECIIKAPDAPIVTVATTTKIRPMQCGLTLSSINTAIEAGPVSGATQYEFEVTPIGGIPTIVTSPVYHFILTNTSGLAAYNKAYSIKVRAFVSGGIGWTNWGDACTVTTPNLPLTKLFTEQCGKSFSSLSITLNANNILLATKYRFKVVNGSTERIVETPRNYFIASELPGGFANNTVYTVKVATLYKGLWSAYGPACNISTPFVRMAAEAINTNVFEVKAFPNPFARHFSLDIQSSSDDLIQVRVYDMIGRELEVQKATVSEWSTKEIGTNYPSGVYNIVVSQGDKVKTIRMIKR